MDFAGMNHSGMADGYVFSNFHAEIVREMDDGSILNVRGFSDLNTVDIASQDCSVPDTGLRAEADRTDNGGSIRNVCGWIDLRVLVQIFVQAFSKCHAANIDRFYGVTQVQIFI